MTDRPFTLSPSLEALYLDEAVGRVSAITAALRARAAPDDADIAWAAEAAHSLKGLTAQAGDTPLAERAHEIEEALMRLRGLGAAERAASVAAVEEMLLAVERALAARPVAREGLDVELAEVASATAEEVRRAAARRGIDVIVDIAAQPGVRVRRSVAGVLLDALGHVARNAVAHGTPQGGSVRLVFGSDGEWVVATVSDRGRSGVEHDAGRPADLVSGRGLGLRAAEARAVAVGGELLVGAGAWGGMNVTLRLPAGVPSRRHKK